MKEERCLHCGETREAIKKHKLFCATVSYEGETLNEWPRHRFTAWTKKELAVFKAEDDYWESEGRKLDALTI